MKTTFHHVSNGTLILINMDFIKKFSGSVKVNTKTKSISIKDAEDGIQKILRAKEKHFNKVE